MTELDDEVYWENAEENLSNEKGIRKYLQKVLSKLGGAKAIADRIIYSARKWHIELKNKGGEIMIKAIKKISDKGYNVYWAKVTINEDKCNNWEVRKHGGVDIMQGVTS